MQIAKGAEAVIEKEGMVARKTRVSKSYRIQAIDDRLRKQRTRSEAALMRTARRTGVNVPKILDETGFQITMEFIEGSKLRDIFEQGYERLGEKIAVAMARLHENNIVHGDLTTSNMMLSGDEVYFIDFGLGFTSNRAEDKAVDLYLLHEAIESTHHSVLEPAWKIILNRYRNHYREGEQVIKALRKIEKRRRYTKKDW